MKLLNFPRRNSNGDNVFAFINPDEVAAVITPELASESHLSIVILKSGEKIVLWTEANTVANGLNL